MYGIIENGAVTLSAKQEKGYKPVIITDRPEGKEGQFFDPEWTETEKEIIQIWTERTDPSKGGLTPDEAWKIIESSNISKENKALLKDYIYKEAK